MRTQLLAVLLLLTLFTCTMESCQKNTVAVPDQNSLSAVISQLQAIAVGSSAASSSAMDSIYVINGCSRSSSRDSISFSSLPAVITDYLLSAYTGYIAQQAYAVTDSAGNASGYIVIIQYKGQPVGLAFDVSGNFVKVLEQKLGRELEGCLGHGGDRGDSTHWHGWDSSFRHNGDSLHYHGADSIHDHGRDSLSHH
ncbi:MAG TPA: hypothetical protein PKM63_08800 [Panacibacter sp.]|nr:hypothetical protein [Panacibacter sp.]HNP44367.1 hypothetical protein [Panacibacter sp.]